MSANPTWMSVALPIAVVGVMTLLAVTLPHAHVNDTPEIRVAFLGNSITFVNDMPRFMQALSGDTMVQNSCLHGALSFYTLLEKGNGMHHKWSTDNALLDVYKDYNVYDYGACTFSQLLYGYDENLSEGDENGYYVNDGKNPCFESPIYYQYLQHTYSLNGPPVWDFVVLNDQTTYPAIYYKRQKSLAALTSTYASIFQGAGVRPVFLSTHGYIAEKVNTTSLGNIPEFTSRVHYGYQKYAAALGTYLSDDKQPLIAPAGLAFLTVWEETPGMWKRLFFTDGFHPSPHGSYLIGCVLYATLYGRMPSPDVALPTNVRQLWSRARKMQIGAGPIMQYPTVDEAGYLWSVAERVVIQGHVPESFLESEEIEALEAADIEAYNGYED